MISRTSQQGFSLFELITVVVVVGVLAASALHYYGEIIDDARKSGLQFLSNRFAAAVAGVHVQWILEGRPSQVLLDGYVITLNNNGWPTGEKTTAGKAGLNTCQQLWESLLQNPARLPDVIPVDERGVMYWAGAAKAGVCRYSLITKDSENFYFEYIMSNGRVRSVLDHVE